MSVRHELAQVRMAHLADGGLPDQLREHVGQCLRCQAEAARYRRIRSALRRLPPPDPPDGLLDEVLARLDAARWSPACEPGAMHVARLVTCALGIASAAGAAGAAVLFSWGRAHAAR